MKLLFGNLRNLNLWSNVVTFIVRKQIVCTHQSNWGLFDVVWDIMVKWCYWSGNQLYILA
jgi:hypothetical protein